MPETAVAIIPARGGSKRIPRKNIKDFLGYPIIKYSIDTALQSRCFDEVMVSTDDREIAAVARTHGATAPFLRSPATSGDLATTADVLREVLRDFTDRGRSFTYGCCIYPTAPLLSPERLQQGYRLLRDHQAETVIPVVRFSYPIQRALKIENDLLLMIWPENVNARSQDLMPTYHDAGQFCWFDVGRFQATGQLFTGRTIPLIIPESEVQDIDTIEDWRIAEMKYLMLTKKEKP
jgi:N-acylneuraminate cytidylyltransferase